MNRFLQFQLDRQEIFTAAFRGDIRKVELILERQPKLLDAVLYNRTLVEYAAERRQWDVVYFLLNKGASLDTRSYGDLFTQAILDGDLNVVRFLLERGVNVDRNIVGGKTALMEASRLGYLNIVRLLLDWRANPNKQDQDGDTPLIYASRHRHSNVISSLLRIGADPNILNKSGRTPLSIAVNNSDQESIRLLALYGATR